MFNYQKIFLHGILLTVTLTFLSLVTSDIIGAIQGQKMDKNLEFTPIGLIIWLVFALNSKRYRK